MIRERRRYRSLHGTIVRSGIVYDSFCPTMDDVVEDTVFPGPSDPGQYFRSHQLSRSGAVMNGGRFVRFFNYVPQHFCSFDAPILGYNNDEKVLSLTANAAASNPSRSDIALGQFIAELRDAPKLLKFRGDTFLSTYAHSTLNTQFGWKPFFTDLVSFARLVSDIQSKLALIKALRKGYVIRSKKKMLPKRVVSRLDGFLINSLFSYFTGDYLIDQTLSGWSYVKWVGDLPAELRVAEADELRAFLAASGTQINVGLLWQLMPWSWLADWTGNIGSYLSTFGNSIPSHISEHYVCSEAKTSVELTVHCPENTSVDKPGLLLKKVFTREVVEPGIAGHMPLIDGYKVDILSALVARNK